MKIAPYDNALGYLPEVRLKQEEYATWYEGEGDLLREFYLDTLGHSFPYLDRYRNSRNYFWSVAAFEPNTKITHSGLPKAIINTLTDLLGRPDISISSSEVKEGKLTAGDDYIQKARLLAILEENNFFEVLKQLQEPYTMAIGDGVFLLNVLPELSDHPVIEFIDGRSCEFLYEVNQITGVIVRKYFSHEKRGYLLTDTRKKRRTEKGWQAVIEYRLYSLANDVRGDVAEEVPLDTIPQTANLRPELVFDGFGEILAVPCYYRWDAPTRRGESLLNGKLDLFDDLDQSLSQSSNTVRRSTPIDYIDEELFDYDEDGRRKQLATINRQFIMLPGDKNKIGDDRIGIRTSQPNLNFNQYNENQLEIVSHALTGLMSPATLGIGLERRDNATAQREKEKVTLITRDVLVDKQTVILRRLFNLVLRLDDFLQEAPLGEYEIAINYPEYANPSFENKLTYLVPAFTSGAISAERYVDELWGDSLTAEEREQEISSLKELQKAGEPPELVPDSGIVWP